MRKVSVSYLLSDEDERRLKKITEGYKKQGLDFTPDKMFDSIICLGCGSEIENKLKFHE